MTTKCKEEKFLLWIYKSGIEEILSKIVLMDSKALKDSSLCKKAGETFFAFTHAMYQIF